MIAIPLGFLQALRRNKPIDYVLHGRGVHLLLDARVLARARADHGVRDPLARVPGAGAAGLGLEHPLPPVGLVLPVATITLVSIAFYSRYVRSSTLENLMQDYVRTARAKGASTSRIAIRHVLRNALVPVVTLVGLSLPFVFAGTLISEQIFNYPGMGLLFYNAAVARDYPVLLGVTLVVGAATVVGSLLADICYALLDPRVRYVKS